MAQLDVQAWAERGYRVVHILGIVESVPNLVGNFCPVSFELGIESVDVASIYGDRPELI